MKKTSESKAWDAKKVSKAQLEKFSKAIKNWQVGCYKNDKEMVKLYKRDRKDLRAILVLLQKGDYEKASQKLYDLDTVVRDQIPTDLYNAVLEGQTIELKKINRSDNE